MAVRRMSLGAGGGRRTDDGGMEYLSRGWQGQAGRGLGGLEQHLRRVAAQEVWESDCLAESTGRTKHTCGESARAV
jgi:hypothetical protein